MNIIIVSTLDYKPLLGGVAEFTHKCALELQRQGHGISVLASHMPGDKEFDTECPYEVVRLKNVDDSITELLKLIRTKKCDLLFFNHIVNQGGLIKYARRYWNGSIILMAHGTEICKGQGVKTSLKKILSLPDRVIANSQFTANLLKQLDVKKGNIHILHPRIKPGERHLTAEDLQAFRKKYQLSPGQTVITLTRLVKRKGLDRSLEAIAQVKDQYPGLRYLIAGQGPEKAILEKIVQTLELQNSVCFIDDIDEKTKALLYKSADIFLMPNRREGNDVEGFGIVFLEANAFEAVPIAGDSGGAPEAVIHEQTGLVVDPHSVRSIAKALQTLLNNPEHRRQLAENGRQRLEQEFSDQAWSQNIKDALLDFEPNRKIRNLSQIWFRSGLPILPMLANRIMKKKRELIIEHFKHFLGRCGEIISIETRSIKTPIRFHIVSAQRNAGKDALRCLNSVYEQQYDHTLIKHVFIDDDSTDDTHQIIEKWLDTHEDHSVEYIHRTDHKGGCYNTLDGFRSADQDDIVIELNGDDWFPDPGVLEFLAKAYQNPELWMTYNSFQYLDGQFNKITKPPRKIIAENAFRKSFWYFSALQTFRRKLFNHFPEEQLTDPQTGQYWDVADDQAFYFPLLEMAGFHARHIHRITYVYNLRAESHAVAESSKQQDRSKRIRALPKLQALDKLDD